MADEGPPMQGSSKRAECGIGAETETAAAGGRSGGSSGDGSGSDKSHLDAVRKACDANSRNEQQLPALRQLSQQPYGFVNDALRRRAWPVLLSFIDSKDSASRRDAAWRSLPSHRDEDQVRLDVERSFVYYPQDVSSSQTQQLKADLLDVIIESLRRHPKLCYFQGFHDIVQVLLLVLGKQLTVQAVTGVSLLRLRDFMLPSLSASLTHLELLPTILAAADPVLARHVAGTKPYFALGATLTLFAHDVESYAEIARLFDFLFSNEAAAAIYLFASIVISRRKELLDIPADDVDMLHFTLSKLPESLDIDALIYSTVKTIELYPPEKLPNRVWSKISKYSILKTTRSTVQITIEEASTLLDAQLAEMAAWERRKRALAVVWAWRKPAVGLGAAVIVGILSFWLQRKVTTDSGTSDLADTAGRLLAFAKSYLHLALN